MQIIYRVDYDFYLELKKKYSNMNDLLFNNFIIDIGNYVIKYCNKEIPFNVIYTTILNVYGEINNLEKDKYQSKLKELKLKNEMDYYNSFCDNWPYDINHQKKS